MTTRRNNLTKTEAVLVATIDAEVSTLDEARSLLSRFQAMIRERRRPDLDTWIEAAARSFLSSFARGLLRIRRPSLRLSCNRGRTARPKGRSPA